MIEGEHAFVLVGERLGPRPRVDRGRALAELARRYLHGHGPADVRDLAKWAGLSPGDACAGISSIAHCLHQRPDGLVDLANRERPPPRRGPPPPRLLGAFDPLLLGWRSRNLVLNDPQEIVTTNDIIKPVALIDGRAAGTWAMPQGRVKLNLWDAVDAATSDALATEAAAVERYLSPFDG